MTIARKHSAVLIPGDGIGPEVTKAAARVIEASGAPIEWYEHPAGLSALESRGEVLPESTLEAIRTHGVALKGPTATPIGGGHTSVNVQIRQKLNLYAAVRPVRSIAGIKTRFDGVEIVIIRENTEGLYTGKEHEVVPGVIETLRIITELACDRIAEFAFQYAEENHREKVSFFHKANIIKMADGLFLDRVRRAAERHPGIEFEDLIIDNGCMQLVSNPSRFDMILLENFYGDLVSDISAGLVGGLGVVPGANISEDCSVFEAVHGTAPDIAGRGIANPLAAIMSGVMMLNHLGEWGSANRIRNAYDAILASGDPNKRTRDIGGNAGTDQFADALIEQMKG